MTTVKSLLILALALSASALGQSKGYTIIPSDKSPACAAVVVSLDEALQVISFPDGQKFLVACDEVAWGNVRHMLPTLMETHHAGTVFAAHTTIIRAAMMAAEIDKFHNLHVLRHEAWHQRLMTADEELVIRATAKEENGQRIEAVYAKLLKEVR